MNTPLDTTIPNRADDDLARRHAPLIRLDLHEPFPPLIVGYTVFRGHEPQASPSFPREINLPAGAVCAIEYAIWSDWDIQHLYELEHIWVYVSADDQIVHAEGSWHGGFNDMIEDGLPLEAGRLILYSEPGKHAFAPVRNWIMQRAETTLLDCGRHAGSAGVLVTPLFEGKIHSRNPISNRATHSWLECRAFEPSFDFSRIFDLRNAQFVQWLSLETYIPQRVAQRAAEIVASFPVNQQHLYKIAHRGASAYAPENSLDAFRTAAAMDADMVEIDIRVTADGVPVVSHDSTLRRLYGVDGVIAEKTLAELRALTPAGVAPIPTFDDVAQVCAGLEIGLYLDIKDFDDERARASVFHSISRYGLLDMCIAGSFDLSLIADIKAIEPRMLTSILFGATTVDPVGLAQAIRADYVHPCWEGRAAQPHTLFTPEWIKRVHAAGLGIVCWHEERPDEIAALRALGVDAICSDTPDRLAVHRVLCS
ncbi:MAG TPA: glycerophosphodiester phosphodiesterase family protein [Phototrophicaceae bacterium]|nr:glycerophosphodiester phosphodiesterase family protein [Phototrophicaceae bacterium]